MRGSMPNCCGGARRRDRDVGQLLRGRVRDDGAVGVDEHPVLQAHEERARHAGDARAGLDDLERRLDGVRRGVRGPGDHAVGQPELDHHRAEVRHRGDDLPRPVHGHALVLAHLGVLDGEPLEQLAVVRVDDRGGVEVEAQLRGARADGGLLAEDREVRDAALQQGRRGAQDPVVAALGEHHVLAVGAGPVQQRELEHQRGDHLGPLHVERGQQRRTVDVLLEQRQGRVDLALRVGREAPVRVADGARGPEGAQLGGQDRQPAPEPVHQPRDQRRRTEPAVEDDPGERREPFGLVRHEQAEQHVRPVARRDHDRPVRQLAQQVLDGHGADDDVEHLARQQRLVARDQGPAHRLRQLPDGRGGEQRVLRHRPRRQPGAVRAGRRGRR